MREILKQMHVGDIGLRYDIDPTTGAVGLLIYPQHHTSPLAQKDNIRIDSLVQAKLIGDEYPKGFLHGKSMRNSATTQHLKFCRQIITATDDSNTIITELTDRRGNIYQHHVQHKENTQFLRMWTTFLNTQQQNEQLEMLSSFSLSGFSPWDEELVPGTLWLTRFKSKWTMEGREEHRRVEDFQLESCWKPSGGSCVKFGQLGSMPVRGYFPFVALEDEARKVAWAVQLELASSWQLEVWCKDKEIAISGGLADRDYGQWLKTIEPGELFTTPTVVVSVCNGDRYDASQRLLETGRDSLLFKENVADESSLPVVFNDFCTNWGRPSESQILEISQLIRDKGIDFYVIDAGWYDDSDAGWPLSHGDWQISSTLFPSGLKSVVKTIHQAGLKAGIWFEIETCGRLSKAFNLHQHLLHRDGHPLTVGDRRFLDMRNPDVQKDLNEKVIEMLRKYNFDYLKIDYNENIGVGIDHKESPSVGLHEVIAQSQAFIRKIKDELPNIIIENCASGGHRLDALSRSLADISSFSDAHETVSIPIVAANLHFLIPPSSSLIWAVLRQQDSEQKIIYSLCATFLGLICLSGDVHTLSEEQWNHVDKGIKFYKTLKNIILEGKSRRFGTEVLSYDKPKGYQAVLRTNHQLNEALVVFHTFDMTTWSDSFSFSLPLPEGQWEIRSTYCSNGVTYFIKNNQLIITCAESFEAAAIKLDKAF
ncbi:alpha-galactosidase [Buttiauxella sp. S04-F03]|uniref:glycoside hydrolase family 36 protein n=1 Tax=Buttiauxella sp. W03-F01 TaxID=2904524 RepID=UPI001E602616|nr:glycoside hydrolase family 36 protein [Buttiauxella sp. W03-F01]MCE0799470.1 alpha-galactosidase [Buttiauxella sp. W03-F01]